jgi:hypothetical protein
MIARMIHDFAAEIDAAIAADWAECLAAVEGFEDYPHVARMLCERRERLLRRRGWWLAYLQREMLREVDCHQAQALREAGRLH